MEAGVEHVFRETFGSALEMGVTALRTLGFRANRAHRAARVFKRHEEAAIRQRFELVEDEHAYIAHVREHTSELDDLLQGDDRDFGEFVDHAWERTPPKSRDSGV